MPALDEHGRRHEAWMDGEQRGQPHHAVISGTPERNCSCEHRNHPSKAADDQ
jgi:hypothetical protein